ncbi:alkyl sulfatase C-terminal domain-containing protein [Roseovarius sp. EL26]|uniref:alkyl sulfatase C-terminal domain-containing protein n=1 Tax=Roseovarius sp. EL26 TaxID=2126672 RepID=UPI000EA17D9C|nr:alkyl sulfatase C-terminal domain-containing protein [Roseovarius sp. EL26]
MLADAFEQIGYQQESPSVRNSFLEGASELRYGVPAGFVADLARPDIIRTMSTSMWLDFIAIRRGSSKVVGVNFVVNLNLPDIE